MSIPLEVENSLLGLALLNQEVLASDIISDDVDGIYFSRLFVKPQNHLWYKISWIDNQLSPINEFTNIDVRIRTGDSLPYLGNITNTRYTFDQMNSKIKAESPNNIDAMLYKWQLNRSLLGITNPPNSITTDSDIPSIFELGTATNTTRLGTRPSSTKPDPIWNYWSVPYLRGIGYIANNLDHDYLQLRINLKTQDGISKIEMYKITISSLLKKGY